MRIFLIIFALVFVYGCNILPKTVQYQKEEEKVLGSVDVINPVVEEIQVMLRDLGYNITETDGKMGQGTRDAVKEFQESMGLKSTGYIDQTTFRQIEDVYREKENKDLKDLYTIKVETPAKEEKNGVNASAKDIQQALKNAGFDPGAVDGKIGPKTKQAIKEFQKTKGLTVDGKVGPKTWSELEKYLEK